MIHGIIAAGGAGASIPFDPYYDALVVMDFQNGIYRVNGAPVAAADLIDRVDTITGSGLILHWNTADPEIALLSTLTDALDQSLGFTVLAEYQQYDLSAYGDLLLNLWNGTFAIPGRHQFQVQSSSSEIYTYDMCRETVDPFNREVTAATVAGEGAVRKVAVTRAPARLTAAVNGGAAVEDISGASNTPAYTSYTLGGSPGDGYLSINCIISKLIFYPVKTNLQLNAITI